MAAVASPVRNPRRWRQSKTHLPFHLGISVMRRSLFKFLRDHLLITLVLCASATFTQAQDDGNAFSHDAWNTLLPLCVHATANGGGTAVDYDCFLQRRPALSTYLDQLSAVSEPQFERWSRDARLAFLINAYNAWTVELILTAYPDVESIRDLGSFLRSPWKKAFIPLFGKEISLDDIEHGMIRKPGDYNEPRIHFAVNCASIGCPALRMEAFTGDKLEEQLEAQTRQFLGDRTRNRLNENTLEVTSLFKWYGDDFASGWRGAHSVAAFLALYADALGLTGRQKQALLDEKLEIEYLDYDWSLNTKR